MEVLQLPQRGVGGCNLPAFFPPHQTVVEGDKGYPLLNMWVERAHHARGRARQLSFARWLLLRALLQGGEIGAIPCRVSIS